MWLGVRTDDEAIDAMKHPELSPFARPGGTGVTGGNDPGFLRRPEPRRIDLPRTLDPPEGWTAGPANWQVVVDLSERLGYRDLERKCAQAS